MILGTQNHYFHLFHFQECTIFQKNRILNRVCSLFYLEQLEQMDYCMLDSLFTPLYQIARFQYILD